MEDIFSESIKTGFLSTDNSFYNASSSVETNNNPYCKERTKKLKSKNLEEIIQSLFNKNFTNKKSSYLEICTKSSKLNDFHS